MFIKPRMSYAAYVDKVNDNTSYAQLAKRLSFWASALARVSSIPTIASLFLFQKQSDANVKTYFRVG